MKTATVADLRNHFPKVIAWVMQGEDVQILRRGKPVAHLVPPAPAPQTPPVPKIDFAAQRKAIWGDRFFTAEEVAEMRAFELEGEEG
jgi:prevent-host-death family protein